jgi:hypothetical protein
MVREIGAMVCCGRDETSGLFFPCCRRQRCVGHENSGVPVNHTEDAHNHVWLSCSRTHPVVKDWYDH